MYDGLNAIYTSIEQSDIISNEGMAYLVKHISQMVYWRCKTELPNTLLTCVNLIRKYPEFCVDEIEQKLLSGLQQIANETQKDSTEYATGEKINIRKKSAGLAYGLCKLYEDRGEDIPCEIEIWKKICKSENEFAEIRNEWIEKRERDDRRVARTGRRKAGIMNEKLNVHHRRSIRLKGYDYSQAGGYFVTVCVEGRKCIFGEIAGGKMRMNEAGEIVAVQWRRTSDIRDEVVLGEWVVMPNHFHGIIFIRSDEMRDRGERPDRGDRRVARTGRERDAHMGGRPMGPKAGSIGAIMAGFKAATTKRINVLSRTPSKKVWQRNYYEHIIRDNSDLDRIRKYIIDNPQRWELDRINPFFANTNG
ncbi:MAG: transposase [Sedimentisphaeraceae bacterium JB056]